MLLLVFQRINWAQWARMLHVSKDIVWISPIVDGCVFLLMAAVLAIASWLAPRLPASRIAFFVFTFLTAYYWLLTTGRLYRRASLLLALGVAVALTRWAMRHRPAAMRALRRSLLPLAAVFIAALICTQGGPWVREQWTTSHLPAAPSAAPNVLVIVVDTLRADHLSCYGYPRKTSPEIDKVAARGVLFENAIAPSSWSLPSHASLLTGRAVHEHGMGNVEPMPWLGWGTRALNGLPTLPEQLSSQGYRTGAFSANRIYFTSNVGLGRGFLHFEDYFDSIGDDFVRSQFGREFARLYMNRSAKSKFTHAFYRLGLGHWLDKDSEGSGDYGGAFGIRKRADEVNREVLDWTQRDSKHPFFVFLNYLDVHYAYGGPRGYPKPSWDQGTTIDEYDAGLKYVDDYIGRLLGVLDRRGLLKNSLVVITSDHGESLGDHGLSFHGAALYRELIHVPLIISYPGHIPAGTRISQPVGNAAIAATISHIVDGSASAFPGPSLDAYWQGKSESAGASEPAENEARVVSELPQTNTIVAQDRVMQGKEPLATDGWMRSVITPRWHLITHEKDGAQLYDWNSDPKEEKNLINTAPGENAASGLRSSLNLTKRR